MNIASFSIYITFWIFQNMSWQSSEYILGSTYARVTGASKYATIYMAEYVWIIIMERVLNFSYLLTFFLKHSINMPQVLNISGFWIFQDYQYVRVLNFCKYKRVLNMHQDAIMEGFWILQDSKYARFLHIWELQKVCICLSMVE